MSDRYVYAIQDATMHLRQTNWGEPDFEVRIVIRDGDTEIVSPPLPDVQLSILAHAFADYIFERTQRVVWPVDGPMLHLYEKERAVAEGRHLDRLRASPDPTSQAQAEAFEVRMRARRRIGRAEPTPELGFEPPLPPSRRRVV